jgi:hypothetical protein
MNQFKAYTHVERIGKIETDGILNGNVWVTPKLDGSNASVWADEEGNLYCGSRKRKITVEKDNAGFANWFMNGNEQEQKELQAFCRKFPHLVVFGEWMGHSKLLGSIKGYNKDLVLNHLWIFNIYNRETEEYLGYHEMEAILSLNHLIDHMVPVVAVMDNPTEQDIINIAENNHFLLNDGCIGEGVVIHNDNFVNCFGRHVVGKYVRPQYKASKTTPKAVEGEVEANIVERCLTNEELEKAKAKIILNCEAGEFDNKMIGMFMNLCWKDMLEENIVDVVKRAHNPIINFNVLNTLCKEKCRKFLGLV